MSAREKPEGVSPALWEAFEVWANEHGCGMHPDDWQEWFSCFMAGVMAGDE